MAVDDAFRLARRARRVAHARRRRSRRARRVERSPAREQRFVVVVRRRLRLPVSGTTITRSNDSLRRGTSRRAAAARRRRSGSGRCAWFAMKAMSSGCRRRLSVCSDAARARHREIGFEVRVVVPHQRRDAVAFLQPEPLERAGERERALVEVARRCSDAATCPAGARRSSTPPNSRPARSSTWSSVSGKSIIVACDHVLLRSTLDAAFFDTSRMTWARCR